MSTDKKRLLRMQEEIEDRKTELAEDKANLKVLKNQLSKEWECGTLEEAEELLQTMKTEKEELDKQITEGIAELEEEYEFED